MAVKKRAIWVDDADWAIISERAKPLNPSTYLRGLALKEPGNGQAKVQDISNEYAPIGVVGASEGRDAADAGDERLAAGRDHAHFDSGSRAVSDGGVKFGRSRPAPKKG